MRVVATENLQELIIRKGNTSSINLITSKLAKLAQDHKNFLVIQNEAENLKSQIEELRKTSEEELQQLEGYTTETFKTIRTLEDAANNKGKSEEELSKYEEKIQETRDKLNNKKKEQNEIDQKLNVMIKEILTNYKERDLSNKKDLERERENIRKKKSGETDDCDLEGLERDATNLANNLNRIVTEKAEIDKSIGQSGLEYVKIAFAQAYQEIKQILQSRV